MMKYVLGTILLAAMVVSSAGCQRGREPMEGHPYDPEVDAPPSAFETPTNPFVLDDPADAPGASTPAPDSTPDE